MKKLIIISIVAFSCTKQPKQSNPIANSTWCNVGEITHCYTFTDNTMTASLNQTTYPYFVKNDTLFLPNSGTPPARISFTHDTLVLNACETPTMFIRH